MNAENRGLAVVLATKNREEIVNALDELMWRDPDTAPVYNTSVLAYQWAKALAECALDSQPQTQRRSSAVRKDDRERFD